MALLSVVGGIVQNHILDNLVLRRSHGYFFVVDADHLGKAQLSFLIL